MFYDEDPFKDYNAIEFPDFIDVSIDIKIGSNVIGKEFYIVGTMLDKRDSFPMRTRVENYGSDTVKAATQVRSILRSMCKELYEC